MTDAKELLEEIVRDKEDMEISPAHLAQVIAFGIYYGRYADIDDSDEVEVLKGIKTSMNQWAAMVRSLDEDEEYKDGGHFGDCNQEPQTCTRCFMSGLLKEAAIVMNKMLTERDNDNN